MKLTALFFLLAISSVESFSQGITLLYKGGGSGGWNNATNWIQINAPAGQTPIQRVPTELDDIIISKSMSGVSNFIMYLQERDESLVIGGSGTTGYRCRSLRASNVSLNFVGLAMGGIVHVYTNNGGAVLIDSGSVVHEGNFILHGGSAKIFDLEVRNSSFGSAITHNSDFTSIHLEPQGRVKLINSSYLGQSFGSYPSGGEVYADNCDFQVVSFKLGEGSKATILNSTIHDNAAVQGLIFVIGPNSDVRSDNVKIIAFMNAFIYTSGSVLKANITCQYEGGIAFLQYDPTKPLPNIIDGNVSFNGMMQVKGDLKLSGKLINHAVEQLMYDNASPILINGQHIFNTAGVTPSGGDVYNPPCTGNYCRFKLELFGDPDTEIVWPVGFPVDTLIINKTNCAKVSFRNSLYVSSETRILGGQLVLKPNDTTPYKFVSAGDVKIAEGGGLFLRKDANGIVANMAVDGGIYDLNTVVDTTCTGFSNTYNGTVTFYKGRLSNGRHTITTAGGASIGNMNLAGDPGTTYDLHSNLVVNNFTFTNPGKLVLHDHNLVVNGVLSGYGPQSYFVTNGAGKLQLNNIGNTATVFPVGPSVASYNPVTLSNAGTPDHFRVRVQPQVLSGGSSGYVHTSAVVDRTWQIEEVTPGGSNATITLHWNEADELSGFTRNAAYLSHHTNGSWDKGALLAASGNNPFSLTRSDLTSFSPFVVAGSASTLPVTLLSFSGKYIGEAVLLDWQIASAINAKQFHVEKSKDGATFQSIATMPVTMHKDYRFIDKTVLAGVNIYRLKMEDLDGQVAYSKLVLVRAPDVSQSMIYPNPVKDKLVVLLRPSNWEVIISVFNASGIRVRKTKLQPGVSSATLPAADLPVGYYTVIIERGQEKETTRFLKQ